jgi:hypothetical protein
MSDPVHAEQCRQLSLKLLPLIADQPKQVQIAVLADLVSIWIIENDLHLAIEGVEPAALLGAMLDKFNELIVRRMNINVGIVAEHEAREATKQ